MISAGGAGGPNWGSAIVVVLRGAASLRLTVVLLLVLVASALAVAFDAGLAGTWVLALPLAALAVNLAAAVATNGVFRRQLPLLLFHLALIALLLLAALGQLMVLHGRAEVTSGTAFDGLIQVDAGPWHIGSLDKVGFINEGFEIEYLPEQQVDQLRNRVRWLDARGEEQHADIERNRPLELFGYRIAPTSNKGFALVLAWNPPGTSPQQEAIVGAVHLPSFPANATTQASSWQPKGADAEFWVQLNVDENLIPADRASQFRLPDDPRIVLRYRDRRWELNPGDRIEVAGGTLQYRELRTWMGYTVFHDWTTPWLVAACALAAASMSWHFWRKFASTPWMP